MSHYDLIVIGAGAAGMMCAATAGQRGRRVLVIEHAATVGEKIRISGGGRCNFTNLHCGPANFLSENPRFCRSALAGYGVRDFLALVEAHGIAWHEKTLGQLFCDDSAVQIIDLLRAECARGAVEFALSTSVQGVARGATGFRVDTSSGPREATRLVIATGGKSIPKIGATGFAYDLAQQFGLPLVTPRPGLVPLVFPPELKAALEGLAGVAIEAVVSAGGARFREALLFTHRGLSGPSILQASSYWTPGNAVVIDLAPDHDVLAHLESARRDHPRQQVATALAEILPRRLAQRLAEQADCASGNLAEVAGKTLRALAERVQRWAVMPDGTEGFRKAEVTVGGVDTRALESRTLEAREVPGLHFIGEAVDVTGHLGGHNFQWAWSSGVAAGRAV
ncbi:MAG: NAD(P)/FAD-dependent oxidoreductase [Gammaproteobacteria bacterium]|nr:NAD(P)/FAD-dependent oxidoreductase [Gammaproteobacteria bacterium]